MILYKKLSFQNCASFQKAFKFKKHLSVFNEVLVKTDFTLPEPFNV